MNRAVAAARNERERRGEEQERERDCPVSHPGFPLITIIIDISSCSAIHNKKKGSSLQILQ